MEAQRNSPVGSSESSDDAYTLQLHRLEPSSYALWLEVKEEVCLFSEVLVLDDTVLDKPYARKMRSCPSHVVRQAPCCCQRDRLADAALDRWRAPLAMRLPDL